MKNYLLIVLGLLTGLFVYLSYTARQDAKDKHGQVLALSDTLTHYKTKDGKNAAYIRVIEGSKKELLAITGKQDKRIHDLIKETKGVRTITNHSTTTQIDTVVKVDTLRLPNTTTPLYLAKHINNEYYSADIVVRGDSLSFNHTSYNEFDYLLQDKPAKGLFGFFRPSSYVVQAINLNPNTQTKHLRTLDIKPKSKTGVKLGVIAAVVAGVLLVK